MVMQTITDVLPKDAYDHLLMQDEDYSYLDLPESVITSKDLYNPLDNFMPLGTLRDQDDLMNMINFMSDPDYIHMAAKHLLNIDLAPFQCLIIQALYEHKMPILGMTRGGSKTFLLGVFGLLMMLLYPGHKIVGVGSGLRQSKAIWDYMCTILRGSPVLQNIVKEDKSNGPKQNVDRLEFRIGESISVFTPLGTGDKIRGLRANTILADEFNSISEEVFATVIVGMGSVRSDPLENTKKVAKFEKLKESGGVSQKVIDEFEEEQSQASNRVILSGTIGYNFQHFYKYYIRYKEIIQSKGDPETMRRAGFDGSGLDYKDFCIIQVPYTALPKGWMDEDVISSARATMPRHLFFQEFAFRASMDSEGFYKMSVIESATCHKPILVSSGERVDFRALKEGKSNKPYVLAVDPAADQDNAAIVILEQHEDHRRVVYCWTFNKKKFEEIRGKNESEDEEYYSYIGRKIRELMSRFPVERIVIDKQGGGEALGQVLRQKALLRDNEQPILEIIEDKSKPSDNMQGLHILEFVRPTSDWNSSANHAMLRDIEQKILLFPPFDTVELEKQINIEKRNGVDYEDYESICEEIEELKTELSTIQVTSTSNLGLERFDTPETKSTVAGMTRKGRLRKDRYSALLMANYYCHSKSEGQASRIEYQVSGTSNKTHKKEEFKGGTGMYYGAGVQRSNNPQWAQKGAGKYVKQKI